MTALFWWAVLGTWLIGIPLVAVWRLRAIGREYAIWNAEVIVPLAARERKGGYVPSYDYPGVCDTARGCRAAWIFTQLLINTPVVVAWPVVGAGAFVFELGRTQGESLLDAKKRADDAEAEIARIKQQEGWV